jgi:hypothetical protein
MERYAAKSGSCPLSMRSGDFLFRFAMEAIAKPMKDGCAPAAETAPAG